MTTQTEDRYRCNSCLHVGPADLIGESVTCSMCDSGDVVLNSVHQSHLRAEREAYMAEWDRIAMQTPAERAAEHAAIRQEYPEFYGAVGEGAFLRRQAS